jgi:colanic acid/amylovoran biosynthesis glycosyltransferase
MGVSSVAYIMSRFPHLPETFIVREMTAIEAQGIAVSLYPLIRQKQPVVHAEAQRWLPRARHLPFVSPSLLAATMQQAVQHPLRTGKLWGQTLWENRTSPNFLVRAMALLPKAFYAAHLMQREGIAHIHAHYATHPALVAWLIHHLTGISYSITVHAHDIFVRTAMLATKLRDAAFIVAISKYNRSHLEQVAGPWVREKTHIIHCGIAPETYSPHPDRPPPQEQFEILNIGSLQPYKGQRFLIEASAMLKERNIPFRCRIIGGGEERGALEQLIAHHNLTTTVELLGPLPQEEVARLLPTAHCYVQPSIITPAGKMEGIPVALMEALACEVPVVATDLSGVPELVRHGETGYLVPPANPTLLADQIARVYTNFAQAVQLARAGRALVLRDFNLHTNTRQLAALFPQQSSLSRPVRLPPQKHGAEIAIKEEQR